MSTDEASHARWRLRRVVEDLERVRRGPQRPLDALEAVRHAQHALADARDLLTVAARREGATWAQIGTALDITRQAAQQAHRRDQAHIELQAEDRAWSLPARPRRRRFRWPFRRVA